MKKKLLIGLILLIVAYYLGGVLLLSLGIITEFPIAPGGLKLQKDEPDRVAYTPESPIIRYDGRRITMYHIIKQRNGLRSIQNNLSKNDTLKCETAEHQFKFLLKSKIDTSATYTKTNNPIFVISDIEGDFDFFHEILLKNKVIDKNHNWAFSKGNLVLLGDYFDRGIDVAACLWLIYKLEEQAKAQGGAVHFVLGNHDVMNLCKEYKYVRNKYFVNADSLKLPYDKWFDENTELGRWLRTKNSIIQINKMLFCHAGINPELLKYRISLSNINKGVQTILGKSRETILATVDDTTKYITSKNGVLWYRGYFNAHDDYPQATQAEIEAVCKFYDVEKIIVGHTIVNEIKTNYNGRVIGIDVLRDQPVGKNKPSALLIENNQFFAVDELGKKSAIK